MGKNAKGTESGTKVRVIDTDRVGEWNYRRVGHRGNSVGGSLAFYKPLQQGSGCGFACGSCI